MFRNIVEAEGFWRRLWEERGTGDENAEWLKEIELAISQRVPLPTVGTWTLETNEAVKVILKKRNWSAPGPDYGAPFVNLLFISLLVVFFVICSLIYDNFFTDCPFSQRSNFTLIGYLIKPFLYLLVI